MSRTKIKQRKSALSLELAIAIPIFVFAAYFALAVILAQTQVLAMQQALDQTAEELEILIPLVEDGVKLAVGEEKLSEFIGSVLPFDSEILRSATMDLASSELLASFLEKRIDYWLEINASMMGLKIPKHQRKILLLWRDEGRSLLIRLFFEQKSFWTYSNKKIYSYTPLWLTTDPSFDKGDEDEEEDTHNVWSESNFSRGRKLREQFGANLAFNTKTIAYHDKGLVKGIRSLDLTAPSYQKAEAGMEAIEYEILRLARYQDADLRQAINDSAAIVKARELLIVVPKNIPEQYDQEFFSMLVDYAAAQGVNLRVEGYLNSYRYSEE